ncbi:MAG: ABC transporter ATP-binding protein, partial [Oscillospiraceae bacterium]
MDMFFAVLSAVSVLLFPLVSGYVTGEVLAKWDGTTARTLLIAGLLLLALTIIKIISNVIYAYFGHAMGAKMEQTMREELFAHYEKLSFSFHAKNSAGKLMSVISNDLTGLTELFHHAPEDLLMTIIKFVGAFAIMVSINVPLTLIVFSCLPVLAIVSIAADKIMERQLLISKRHLSEMNEHLEDTLSGIRTVKAFGNEKQHSDGFSGKNTAYTKAKCGFYKVEAYFYETLESYPQFLTMLVVVFGALFIGQGKLDVAVLVTFILYSNSLAEPIRTMLNFMRLFEEGKTSFIRFMDMIEATPAVGEGEHPVSLGNVQGAVRFDHVSFHYEGAKENVLENISFHIKSGQTVAFAGVSGIGKTTISALIARFYDVTAGKVFIDEIDIKDIALKSLRETIGIV